MAKSFQQSVDLGYAQASDVAVTPPLKVAHAVFAAAFIPNVASCKPTPLMGPALRGKLTLSSFKEQGLVWSTVASNHAKAVKSDDALTDTSLWDREVSPEFEETRHGRLYTFLRKRMARRFAHNVWRSFQKFLAGKFTPAELSKPSSQQCEELRKDLAAGGDAVLRARRSSFWDWDDGSTPFFWRWQPEVRKDMRDGTKICIKGPLPKNKLKQTLPRDPSLVEKIKSKIAKVRSRRYISSGLVLSLTNFFQVPKGVDDIRMVYDLTKCGLNAALWAPSFWMPTVDNVVDCVTDTGWFGDVDAGEMFLNYILDETIRPYAGVDMSWTLSDRSGTLWERWSRMAMGMLPSPYITIRLFAWAMEIIKGNRLDENNPFHWSELKLNCPGDSCYDPGLPVAFKWNPIANGIACDCKTFVDDLRSTGPTRELTKAATHQVETRMSYLGLQDATRKRRPITQQPGEWTGSVSLTVPGVGVFVTVSQSKWDKAKGLLHELAAQFENLGEGEMPQLVLADLESKVGFLVHLAMAYPLLFPFLRGFYLTMNSWRPGRDLDGWKLSKRAHAAAIQAMRRNGVSADVEAEQDAPEFVTALPLFKDHLFALLELFEGDEPTLRLVRGTSIFEVLYIFGDASGRGFGSTWNELSSAIGFRYGIWGVEGRDTSSNYREFRNLVETLEALGRDQKLVGREVFIFTDNSTSEAIAAKGSSTSPILFDLVVRLFKLEMSFCCKIKFVHVAGTRMIAQGTGGLSRGGLFEGVL